MAIKDGKFLRVGPISDIEEFIGDNTEVVDLDRKFVMPGLGDPHLHPALVGRVKSVCYAIPS